MPNKPENSIDAGRASAAPRRTEANRLGVDYRNPPARRVAGPMVDIHTHIHALPQARHFFEAARAFGVAHVVSMSPLPDAPRLADEWGEKLSFIAIPNWRAFEVSHEFQSAWIADLASFRELGARLCKFWVAPPMRKEHGLTLDHEFLRTVIWEAYELGFDFMVHVADPSVWWRPGARYADSPAIGSKERQYEQLEWLLESVAPRTVVAAHMGGFVENPAFLANLLDRFDNLVLDTSATKWIVREVANRPREVRDLILSRADRFLFGSDLVVSKQYDDFDHYASRYWAHQAMWESAASGESPIEDPDADDPPRLAGVDLPEHVLRKIYWENAQRLEFAPALRS